MAIYGRSRKTTLISNKLYDYRVARKGSLMDTMRYDDETRLLEHVKIYSAVLADWHRDDLDAQHADDRHTFYVIWCCTMQSGCWVRAAAKYSMLYLRCSLVPLWGAMLRLRNVLLLLLPYSAQRLPTKAPSARACRRLMFDYDVLRSGFLRACKRMAANILGKRDVDRSGHVCCLVKPSSSLRFACCCGLPARFAGWAFLSRVERCPCLHLNANANGASQIYISVSDLKTLEFTSC